MSEKTIAVYCQRCQGFIFQGTMSEFLYSGLGTICEKCRKANIRFHNDRSFGE